MLVLIVGRPVGARLALLEDAVLPELDVAELVDVLEVSIEVVVNVGRPVSVLVSVGALPLVSVRSALVLLVAAAELLSVMLGGGWECGRREFYRGCLQS